MIATAETSRRATAETSRRGSFSSCVQASSGGHTRLHILDALESNARRQPAAELLRSLVPPAYLQADQEMDLHLRSMFLTGSGLSAVGGASGLCRIGMDTPAEGPASAVIMRPGERVGVLVYDDSRAMATVDMRMASHRLQRRRLAMYDSSMFPLPTGASANQAAPLARRLLPPFATGADYLGRVVLLTGLDAETCYATEFAYFLEHTVRVGSEVEAVVVHQAQGAVLVVLGRPEDAVTLQRLPQETWTKAFRRPVACHLLDLEATPREMQPPIGPPLRLTLQHWISPMAFAIVRLHIGLEMDACPSRNLIALTRGLIMLAALSQPDALRRGHFPDRAVLMTRIGSRTRRWDLRDALLRYGALDEVVHDQSRGVALVIFTSWTGAARLLREPPASRLPRGFGACQPAPYAGFASVVVDRILNHLLIYQTMVPPYL